MHRRWRQPLPAENHCQRLKLETSGTERVLRVLPRKDQTALAVIHRDDAAMKTRLNALLKVAARVVKLFGKRWPEAGLALQLHDEDPQIPCLRMDADIYDANSCTTLIPDPYCLATDGFANFRHQVRNQVLPPWQQRLDVAFWRGATTGNNEVTHKTLQYNQRYKLCKKTLELEGLLDARFNRVVQAVNCETKLIIEQDLRQQNLLAPTVSPWHCSLHRWIIDIDGNVNSWGLLWKLLSGSCVLKVESQRCQWFHRRIRKWKHLIPIKSDLSDLKEKLQWCKRNSDHCATIANAGQRLAIEIVDEIDYALLSASTSLLQYKAR